MCSSLSGQEKVSDNTQRRTIIVAGVSSAGKSTFIEKFVIPDLQTKGLYFCRDIDLVFARTLFNKFSLGSKTVSIIHYNTIVGLDFYPDLGGIVLSEDPVFARLLAVARDCDLYICYAPDHILRDRIDRREMVEPVFQPTAYKYPKEHVIRNLEKVDQRQLVIDFADQFRGVAREIKVVLSGDNTTDIVRISDFMSRFPVGK